MHGGARTHAQFQSREADQSGLSYIRESLCAARASPTFQFKYNMALDDGLLEGGGGSALEVKQIIVDTPW